MKNRRLPVEVAKDILQKRFPKALFGFVAGSFHRGEATTSSDIDLVVIFEKLEFAWRESFMFEGWPVEAFVHDPETLNYFFKEVDGKDGVPSLPAMVAEGTVVPNEQQLSQQLKSLAQSMLSETPPEWTKETIYHQRYGLTDLIDDLRDPRNSFEANIIVGAIHEALGNFYFRSKGQWSASRKHIPRRLLKLDPEMGKRWISVFEDAYRGNHTNLINLAEEILKPYGGLLFDGYKRDAPKEWRSDPELPAKDNVSNQLQQVIKLRRESKPDQAFALLNELLKSNPEDPNVNYQMAWTCDFTGKESEAAPYYEKAIANGLAGRSRQGAMLGLGSTYRCLGEYEKSLRVFNQAISEFPQDRSFKVFRALTNYNLGKTEDSVGELLGQLLDTSNDQSIKSYEKALRFYSDKLNETWK